MSNKKIKLIMAKGLIASGKTTWVKERIEETSKICKGYTRRINKDDLREMCDNSIWTKHNEKTVIEARNALIDILASNPDTKEIVIDDTNLNPDHERDLRKIAEDKGWEFEVKEFKISLREAIERDKKRDNPVGEKVINRMYWQYIEPNLKIKDRYPWLKERDNNLPNAILVDMDGTTSLMIGRNPYDTTKCNTDIPNIPVVEFIKGYEYNTYNDVHIIFMSGREDSARELTKEWLRNNDIIYTHLFMRKTGDIRPDTVIKKELYEEYVKDKYNILFCIEDRPCMVRLWKELNIFVFNVYQDIDQIEF